MEPAPEERDDQSAVSVTPAMSTPQWSPLLKSGMTGELPPGHGRHAAAMEPAPEERDDDATRLSHHPFSQPQWSPLLKSGMTGQA